MIAQRVFRRRERAGDLGKTGMVASPIALLAPSGPATRSLGLMGMHRFFTEQLLWSVIVAAPEPETIDHSI